MGTASEIEWVIRKIKTNERIAEKDKSNPETASDRTIYSHRIALFNFTAEEVKEIASAFHSRFYILPDDIKNIDFGFSDGYVFVYVRTEIPEDKVSFVKAVIHHYAAQCELPLKDRKIYFIEAYENFEDFSKYSSIQHHVDYRIKKGMIMWV